MFGKLPGKNPDKNDKNKGNQPRRGRRPKPPRQCAACKTWNSTQWREGPPGLQPLCNACGIRYRRCVEKGLLFDPRIRKPKVNPIFHPDMPRPPPKGQKRKKGPHSDQPPLKKQNGPRPWGNDTVVLPNPFLPGHDQSSSFVIPKGQSSTFGMQGFNNGSNMFGSFGSGNPFGTTDPNGLPQPVHPPLDSGRPKRRPKPFPFSPPQFSPPSYNDFPLPPLAPGQQPLPMPGYNAALPMQPGYNHPNMNRPIPMPPVPQRPRDQRPRGQRNRNNPRSSQKLPSFKKMFKK